MKDPRLIPVEIAIALIQEVPQRQLRGIDVRSLKAEAQTLAYSFMPLEELVDQGMLVSLINGGRKLLDLWKKLKDDTKTPSDFLAVAKVRFAGLTLSGLGSRVNREPKLHSGVDAYWGKIISVKKFEGLRATVVDAGDRFDVVTNLPVEEEQTMAFAVLPPRRFGNYISEAMFIDAEGDGRSGQLAKPSERGKGAIEAVLREEAARLKIKIY